MERTIAIIKPDAVRGHHVGEIIAAVEAQGLTIEAMEFMRLTKEQARGFYSVHEGKHFFERLLDYMTSGPIVAMVLSGDDAITRWRSLMGPTNPESAGPETLRGRFGESLTFNAVHGSDASETASYEMSYLFGGRYLNGLRR
ncbi:nucleoside-diphosphate kinase [Myxococcota bacterium]|nr:nucleoside-diphosphate kinase [Myxococcota bacterium]